MLVASLLTVLLQVGPNPTAGALPGTPEELLDRPPRNGIAEAPESEWLSQCLRVLETDAARAHTLAQIRRNASPPGPDRLLANHCLGLAATALGRWDDAVDAFAAARDDTPVGEPRARSRFAAMAGNAALAQEDFARAIALLSAARADAREAASATLEAIAAIDMARALVADGQLDEALEPLDTAVRLLPAQSDAWLLKATLLRRLDRLNDAQAAIEEAALRDTKNPMIGLEAGVIAVLAGREDAARASWESVVALDPESAAAATARDYLAQIGSDAEQSS